jgi:hypothetical protein
LISLVRLKIGSHTITFTRQPDYIFSEILHVVQVERNPYWGFLILSKDPYAPQAETIYWSALYHTVPFDEATLTPEVVNSNSRLEDCHGEAENNHKTTHQSRKEREQCPRPQFFYEMSSNKSCHTTVHR